MTTAPPPWDGILLVDKPKGMTSFDVLRRLRRPMQRAKMGHTGTLDPMATGVLAICVGWSTRLVPWLTAADKAYDGTFRLGIVTDTDDADGTAVSTFDGPLPDVDAVRAACAALQGDIDQVPPAYSAVHVDGERAYRAARRGDPANIPPRRVHVARFDVTSFDGSDVGFRTEVSKGTYVRSLARDVGAALGCGAHLTSLRRTHSGAFELDACVGLAELVERLEAGEPPPLISPWDALHDLPSLDVDEPTRAALRVGQRPVISQPAVDAPLYRVANASGELLALATVRTSDDGSIAVVERVRPGA